MRRKFEYAQLGTISHGTLRTEDLLDSLGYELGQLSKGVNAEHSRLAKKAQKLAARYDDLTDEELEKADHILNEELFDALNEYTAPFCYFGSSVGDGSDFGFWLSGDSLEDARRYGEIDEETGYISFDGYLIDINDHGNVTIYDHNGKELVSCV